MDFRKQFRVKPGEKVKLSKVDPDFVGDWSDKEAAKERTQENAALLADLQYQLYSENRRSLLIILQAMDAGGKDGTINHVLAPMNPQGCRVQNFKSPTAEELAHDFLWRVHRVAPKRGEVVIFNRSHYEDVLIARVHRLAPKEVWSRRYAHIRHFESLLADSGVTVLKFYLHISKSEQLKRFEDRFNEPDKHWKISEADYAERRYWDDYMAAFEDAFEQCSTDEAPWFIIPADKKYFRNLAVSQIIADTMREMKLQLPAPTVDLKTIKAEIEAAKREA